LILYFCLLLFSALTCDFLLSHLESSSIFIEDGVGYTLFRSRAIALRSRAITAIANATRIPAGKSQIVQSGVPVAELSPVTRSLVLAVKTIIGG
jgi:hypothetical protein